MKRLVLATALLSTIGLQAQVLNVNNKNGTYLPLDTKNTKEITFNESDKIVTLTTSDGAQHCFYTEKVESLSPKTDKSKKLTYNLTPTVVFDNNDQSNFTEKTEVIPTDESDDNYGDYVENWDAGTETEIVFCEDGVSVNGEKKETTHLTIKSTSSKVVYIVSGKCSNGSLKIYSEKKFQLVLTGLELTNPNGPAINIQTGKTVYFTIADNTTNNLCDGETYNAPVIGEDGEEEDQKGTLFSEGQLIFDGSGTLNVTSHGGHGICSDDYIRIRSGNINILSAAKDGFRTKDKFIVSRTKTARPRITINATNDGIECSEGEVVIDAGIIELTTGGEAIKVEYEETDTKVTPNATINGGYIKFVTTGEKSSGVKTTGKFTLNDGIIHGTVEGNGSKILNCDNNITISKGTLTGFAKGTVLNNETSAGGIKCEGDISINGGTISIECTGKGAKGVNCDNTISINGGEVTVLTDIQDFNDKYTSVAIETNNLVITNGTTVLRSDNHAVNATKVSLFDGTLQTASNESLAIDAEISQTGGWLIKKDAE